MPPKAGDQKFSCRLLCQARVKPEIALMSLSSSINGPDGRMVSFYDSDEEEHPQQVAPAAPPPGLRNEDLPALFW